MTTVKRNHKLLTAEIKKKLPILYSQADVKDPIVQVKFFAPYSNWRWFGIEFDGVDKFFGYVQGLDSELGYFLLSELDELTAGLGRFSVPAVERDLSFTPKPLSAIKASLEAGGVG